MRIAKFVLLIVFVASFSISFAQKAYETIKYSSSLNGVSIKLSLADGYILGSKIEMLAGAGKRATFIPENAFLDDQQTLKFFTVNSHAKSIKNHFVLDGTENSLMKIPSQIFASYYNGKKQYKIIFKKEK